MAEQEEEYDPHEHRKEMLEYPTNNIETFFNLIKGCFGTGVLAMPEAFKYTGMINGIVSLLVLALFATYCIHVLVRSQYALCKKKRVGLLIYSKSMEAAAEFGPPVLRTWGRVMGIFADFFLIFYQFGLCCVYWVFIGKNLKYVIDVYCAEKQPLYYYMLALIIPFCLIMCVRNLKIFAPFSMVADVITLVTFGVVFYYIFSQLDANFNDRPAVGNIQGYPLFVGTVLFSLQSVPMVIGVENNMKTPEYFRKPFGSLNTAFSILTLSYLMVGICGYWRYGEDIQPSITMNFPPEEIMAEVIICSYCIAIFVTYGLNAYVPINIICTSYLNPKLPEGTTDRKKLIFEMLIRLGFVILTCILATTIPLLGIFISLCGSVGLSALGIIFPGILEICAYWEEEKTRPNKFTFWKDMGMIILGFAGLLTGLYSAILAMIEKLSSEDY
ncbi:unnamed protein product [Ceutorhynchus assimilis]|uniref:Amino acid transporter transmembrane domain-containing protein n=1 Tax=Ceutorhynchus assimilis TaxID=467358 RepID=A0A9N9MCM9_9CUCU|nr:unnamed protein product [Ceutorhynchus assimilis]